MEGDPFAILEGMTIAAFAVGAEKGFIYVRGEYPLAAERLAQASRVREGARIPRTAEFLDFRFTLMLNSGAEPGRIFAAGGRNGAFQFD